MKKTILIVEDEESLLSILTDRFEKEDFRVLCAKNGKEGLECALQNKPDLILLDIIMPVMDGLTMLHKLKADTWGKQARVILLTNLSDPGKITESVLKKVVRFIVKSDWQIADVVREVKHTLSNH